MKRGIGYSRRPDPFVVVGLAVLLTVACTFSAWYVLQACGVAFPFWRAMAEGCPREAPGHDPQLEATLARQAQLENRVAELEIRLARLGCRPRPPPPPEPPPAPDPNLERWANRDIRVLEGCWELVSDYRTQQHSGFIAYRWFGADRWDMCFDAAGNGEQTLRSGGGTTCRGGTIGRFGGSGNLEIRDREDMLCSDGWHIHVRRSSCELQADGALACTSYHLDRGQSEARVRFRRR
ncbi:MAG: hypothetical protein OXF88_05560 [Rhodobacteraceae bacterium]|nr:hypothetical protein [Paracoccaceae bacterium]MCY4137210.1 hypothetical protein [Paracoccaceae bacterium]